MLLHVHGRLQPIHVLPPHGDTQAIRALAAHTTPTGRVDVKADALVGIARPRQLTEYFASVPHIPAQDAVALAAPTE